MPTRALTAAAVRRRVVSTIADVFVDEVVDQRDEQQQDELLAVGEAGRPIRREGGGQQRPPGIEQQRQHPRRRRRTAPLLAERDDPGDHGNAEEDLADGDRELHRGDRQREGDERDAPRDEGRLRQRSRVSDCRIQRGGRHPVQLAK